MTWDASRRVFLRGASLAAVGVGLAPTSLLVRTARAAVGDKVLVKVFLRGGADGLNLCAPYGDPEYYNLRQGIALPRPGSSGGVVNLDGYFGMHPEFAPLQPYFDDGRLAFVHAVGNPQVTRSHFDAQDFQESGTPGDKQTPTGWLDRAIARIPGSEVTQAVSFSSQLVRSFLGPEPVLVAQTLSSFDLHARNWRARGRDSPHGDVQGRPDRRRHHRARDLRGGEHTAAGADAAAVQRRGLPDRHRGQLAPAGGRARQDRDRHALHLRQRDRRLRHPLEPAHEQRQRLPATGPGPRRLRHRPRRPARQRGPHGHDRVRAHRRSQRRGRAPTTAPATA